MCASIGIKLGIEFRPTLMDGFYEMIFSSLTKHEFQAEDICVFSWHEEKFSDLQRMKESFLYRNHD